MIDEPRGEVARLLQQKFTLGDIAEAWDVSLNHVVEVVYREIGRGHVRRSAVFFHVDEPVFSWGEQILESAPCITRAAFLAEIENYLDESTGEMGVLASLFFDVKDAPLTDLFEDIIDLERYLHSTISSTLAEGDGEGNWWRLRIPLKVRTECATALESDPEPAAGPYCYTNFIHLWQILNQEWGIFSKILPKAATKDKKLLEKQLLKVNALRNRVMHPARAYRPQPADLKFVASLRKKLME